VWVSPPLVADAASGGRADRWVRTVWSECTARMLIDDEGASAGSPVILHGLRARQPFQVDMTSHRLASAIPWGRDLAHLRIGE
jgi:hypothetical protein